MDYARDVSTDPDPTPDLSARLAEMARDSRHVVLWLSISTIVALCTVIYIPVFLITITVVIVEIILFLVLGFIKIVRMMLVAERLACISSDPDMTRFSRRVHGLIVLGIIAAIWILVGTGVAWQGGAFEGYLVILFTAMTTAMIGFPAWHRAWLHIESYFTGQHPWARFAATKGIKKIKSSLVGGFIFSFVTMGMIVPVVGVMIMSGTIVAMAAIIISLQHADGLQLVATGFERASSGSTGTTGSFFPSALPDSTPASNVATVITPARTTMIPVTPRTCKYCMGSLPDPGNGPRATCPRCHAIITELP